MSKNASEPCSRAISRELHEAAILSRCYTWQNGMKTCLTAPSSVLSTDAVTPPSRQRHRLWRSCRLWRCLHDRAHIPRPVLLHADGRQAQAPGRFAACPQSSAAACPARASRLVILSTARRHLTLAAFCTCRICPSLRALIDRPARGGLSASTYMVIGVFKHCRMLVCNLSQHRYSRLAIPRHTVGNGPASVAPPLSFPTCRFISLRPLAAETITSSLAVHVDEHLQGYLATRLPAYDRCA
ncbi:hypothetical protein BDY17DRAFT_123700 [Neohortaea acidophila]|uniref:Uncharacterized protein n=1 Tax=Neohortaea acidophila TaxID=245834 RepID=A0A6A6PWT1_9PEZI|nr:uncharacterized protein BDY17DRAFT_123700 [Neohortaea acidophila]KAF2484194.1 hypothetical protein BDY17DRAFT_123700 [Neohortaea acidophila]